MARLFRFFVLIIVFLSVFAGFEKPAVAANENIKITIAQGFDGKIKRGKGFPLTIIIENDGKDFSGDLLIDYMPSHDTGGAKMIHIELPEKGTKTYSITLPGFSDNHPAYYNSQSSLRLYEGSWQKGKKIAFKGEQKIKPKFIDDNRKVIGVLSENYDRLKELRGLSSANFELLPITKEEIPKEAIGLEMIDYIIIDEYPLSQLEEEQQQAIKAWIQAGGVLIAGGAPDEKAAYGSLYSLLPMKADRESEGNTNFLTTSEKTVPFDEIRLFIGEVEKEAKILVTSDDLPVAIKKEYGGGAILQTAFSLGDQPLSTWDGYSVWFEDFLGQAPKADNSITHYGDEFYSQLFWELGEPNEYFPSSQYSIPILVLLILLYIIIIVPVLYFILKKVDKREHSWWIIPSLGFLVAIGVFAMGAKDRIAKPQLNQMGIYKVADDYLTGYQATTLLSNKSGEYRLSIPKGEFSAISSNWSSGVVNLEMEGIIEDKRKTYEMIYKDVAYWSTKTVFGKAQVQSEGDFHTELTLRDGRLSGTIENRFPYDFEEVFIWSGHKKIDIGPLKTGEKKKINKETGEQILSQPKMLSRNNGFWQDDLEKYKKERLENAAAAFLFIGSTGNSNEPFIGGITTDTVVDVKLVDKKQKENNYNLIVSPFSAKNEITGEFTLTGEMLSMKWNIINGDIHDVGKDLHVREAWIEDGEYELIFALPEALEGKELTFERIRILVNNSDNIQLSILNWEKEEYLQLDSDKSSFNLTKENKVDSYVSEKGEIILKINKYGNGEPYVVLPEITVKGEVAS